MQKLTRWNYGQIVLAILFVFLTVWFFYSLYRLGQGDDAQ